MLFAVMLICVTRPSFYSHDQTRFHSALQSVLKGKICVFFKMDSFIPFEGDEAELVMLLLNRYGNAICTKRLIVFYVMAFITYQLNTFLSLREPGERIEWTTFIQMWNSHADNNTMITLELKSSQELIVKKNRTAMTLLTILVNQYEIISMS